MNDLQAEFRRWQSQGYIGDPLGEEGFGYARASSEKQVEEGSSFPRQIENIHRTAFRDHVRIPYSNLYFDDGYTGFEFDHRPALTKLRQVLSHKGGHLVIEDIDRLSRDSDWQQGFLLSYLAGHGVSVHFFVNPGSNLERYVRGYIAQEGMKRSLDRMKDGTRRKAIRGQVTAKKAKYGYLITDRKDSHYELHPEESKVMRWVYEQIIYKSKSLKQIAIELNDQGVVNRADGYWTGGSLYYKVTSPVYKGEFYANVREAFKTGEFNEEGRPKWGTRIKSRDEWILVPCPMIVTPEEWDTAQAVLKKNSTMAKKNSKQRDWLLQGLVKCDICKVYSMTGTVNPKKVPYYNCYSSRSLKAQRENACGSPYILAEEVERRVWEELEAVIYDPKIIIKRLEERQNKELEDSCQTQLDFIAKQIQGIAKERSKYEKAYERDIYTLDEFDDKMKELKGREHTLGLSLAKVQAQMAEVHTVEEQKRVVVLALGRIKEEVDRAKEEGRQPKEIPFELKRKLVRNLLDVVYVNTVERTFSLEGEIKGTFAIDFGSSLAPTTRSACPHRCSCSKRHAVRMPSAG